MVFSVIMQKFSKKMSMGSFGGIPGPGAKLLSNKKSAFESFEMNNIPTRKNLNKSKSNKSEKEKSPKLDKSEKKKKSPKPEKRKPMPAESGKNNLKTRFRKKTFSVVYFKRAVKKDKHGNLSSAESSDGKGNATSEESKPFIRKSPRLVIKSVARKAGLSRSGDSTPTQCDSPKLTKSHRINTHCDSPGESRRSPYLDSPKLTTKLHCQNSPQLERSLNFERSSHLRNSMNRNKVTSVRNGHNSRLKPQTDEKRAPNSQSNSALSSPSMNLKSLARDKSPKHSTPNSHKSLSLSTSPGSSPSRSPIASGRSSPVFGSKLSPIIKARSARSSPTFSTKSTWTSSDLLSPTEAQVYYELVREGASFNEPWDFDDDKRLIPGTATSKGIKRDRSCRSPKNVARRNSIKKIKN